MVFRAQPIMYMSVIQHFYMDFFTHLLMYLTVKFSDSALYVFLPRSCCPPLGGGNDTMEQFYLTGVQHHAQYSSVISTEEAL